MFFVWKVDALDPRKESDQQAFLDNREAVEKAVLAGEPHRWLIGVDMGAREIFDPDFQWIDFGRWFRMVDGWQRLADLIPGYEIPDDIRRG